MASTHRRNPAGGRSRVQRAARSNARASARARSSATARPSSRSLRGERRSASLGSGVAGGQGRNVTSVRLGDVQRQAKRDRKRPARRRTAIVVAAVLAVLVALAVGVIALMRAPVFVIENLDVQGADHLTGDEISHLVNVPEGTTLLSVDADGIANSLKRDAWVEEVQVNRQFPSTLQVVVTERQVGAIIEVPTGSTQLMQIWAMSTDGMWLMPIPARDSDVGKNISQKIYEDADSAMRIVGLPAGIKPEIGTYCTDDAVNDALSIVDGMTTELASQVRTVSAADPSSTLLTLTNGVEIAFGDAQNIREKERICLEILSKNEGKVAYINVRVPERPTYRAA